MGMVGRAGHKAERAFPSSVILWFLQGCWVAWEISCATEAVVSRGGKQRKI